MFVFDTSAFINGSRHYFLDTMRPVWTLVEEAIEDGRVVVPREVYREVVHQDDEIARLVKRHRQAAVDPSAEVQGRAGAFQLEFPKPGLRDRADPFIMAEARLVGSRGHLRGHHLLGSSGERRRLPSICARLGIACCTLPQALQRLGLKL